MLFIVVCSLKREKLKNQLFMIKRKKNIIIACFIALTLIVSYFFFRIWQSENSIESVYTVQLKNGISFRWSNTKSMIIKDGLLDSTLQAYPNIKKQLVHQILDNTKVPAMVCTMDKNLRKGDLAFLLLLEIGDIPLLKVFQIQWDSYKYNCFYPSGLMKYISNNRKEAKEKLEQYFLKNQ